MNIFSKTRRSLLAVKNKQLLPPANFLENHDVLWQNSQDTMA